MPKKIKMLNLNRKRPAPENRPTANARGYNYAWQKVSRAVRIEEPVCRICQERPSEDADHITPWQTGATEEERNILKYSRSNLQGVCKACHARKTLEEQRR